MSFSERESFNNGWAGVLGFGRARAFTPGTGSSGGGWGDHHVDGDDSNNNNNNNNNNG